MVGLILVSTFGNSGVFFFCFVVPERASGIIMQSGSVKVSPFDLMSAIIKGSMDQSNVSSGSGGAATLVLENREFIMIVTTSIAVLIGCVVVLIWRRFGQKSTN